ncbi:CNGA1 [Symbiodinium pilosum]|uniref:CNGA1 protein n=1 Tax=Symbiodinium pilosum TaxID=2952 RepID=A0A812JP88_SYMPI|nr:CNGA1 [Symbiodinium pilosum]
MKQASYVKDILALRGPWKTALQPTACLKKQQSKSFHALPVRASQRMKDAWMDNGCLQSLVLPPNSKLQIMWSVIGSLFIVWDLITIPLELFDIQHMINFLVTVGKFSFEYWVIDMPLHLIFGVEIDGRLHGGLRAVQYGYFRSWFTIDCIVISVDAALIALQDIQGTIALVLRQEVKNIGHDRLGYLPEKLELFKQLVTDTPLQDPLLQVRDLKSKQGCTDAQPLYRMEPEGGDQAVYDGTRGLYQSQQGSHFNQNCGDYPTNALTMPLARRHENATQPDNRNQTTTGNHPKSLAESSPVRSARYLRTLRLLRLIRLLRVAKLQQELTLLANNFLSAYAFMVMKVVSGLLMILAVNHLIACCWYGLARWTLEESSGGSWLTNAGVDTEDFANAYAFSIHWSLTQFTPATNNIAPVNFYERFFAVWVILLAMGTFSSFISSITTTVSTMRASRAEEFKNHSLLVRFFTERNLSVDLFGKVSENLKKQGAYGIRLRETDVRLLKGVPDRLKVVLHEEMFKSSLMSLGFWRHWRHPDDEAFCRQVCHLAMQEHVATPGADAFTPGQECEEVYIIEAGSMNLGPLLNLALVLFQLLEA